MKLQKMMVPFGTGSPKSCGWVRYSVMGGWEAIERARMEEYKAYTERAAT